jgi:hypothetical protein
MQTTYFDIKPAPTTPLEACERRLNHAVAHLVSRIGKKINVSEVDYILTGVYYISNSCYFAGLTLVHPDACRCDDEYESYKETL